MIFLRLLTILKQGHLFDLVIESNLKLELRNSASAFSFFDLGKRLCPACNLLGKLFILGGAHGPW